MQDINKGNIWNAVKGIGILCIVIGHTCGAIPSLVRFVYLFHLALFFFVSGYLYKEEKYGDLPHLNFAARLRSTWPKYTGYMAAYVLLHNLFLRWGVIINASQYSRGDTLIALVNTMLLNGSESMGGALWFVPVLLVASGLFGMVIYLGRAVQRITGWKTAKLITILLGTLLLGAVGVYTNHYGMNLSYHVQTAFLVVPLFTAAWLLRTYVKNLNRWLHWLPGILVLAALLYGKSKYHWQVELSTNMTGGPVRFYGISLAGIYLCLTLAKYAGFIPPVKKLLDFLGRYSFDIMAGHFLVIKLIDILYARVIGEADPQVFGRFPQAYSGDLWWLYVIAASLLPALAAHGWSVLKHKLFAKKAG